MWLTRSGVNDRLLGVCHNIALIVAANILPSVIFFWQLSLFQHFIIIGSEVCRKVCVLESGDDFTHGGDDFTHVQHGATSM